VKNFEPIIVKNMGDSPKKAMLVPDAMPMYLGKVFEAANRDE
jgi:hypothetical protein